MYAERKRDVDGFDVEFSRAVWFEWRNTPSSNGGRHTTVMEGSLQQ